METLQLCCADVGVCQLVRRTVSVRVSMESVEWKVHGDGR